MSYNNNMSYSDRIDKHYAKGFDDAQKGEWNPGLIIGQFMVAYRLGQSAAKVAKMEAKRLADFKQK
jgi:hypothetical protein